MGLFGWLGPAKKRKRKPQRYVVERVSLNRGGYDRHGRYWGIGERLYRVDDEETGKSKHVRAESAKSARAKAVHDKYGWR